MNEDYPDVKPPDIKVVKRKGLTTGQIQSLSEKLGTKAGSLIGNEMVFDLVEEAKSILSAMAKKKVSFHDEMLTRQVASEKLTKAAQLEQKAKIDELEENIRQQLIADLESKVKQELDAKEKLFQSELESEELKFNPIRKISEVTFVPELVFPINGVQTTLHTVKLTASTPVNWVFGELHRGIADNGLEVSVLIVKFTSNFYSTSQGSRKLEALVKHLRTMAHSLPSSIGLVKIFGAQIERIDGYPTLQVAMEPIAGIRLDHVLNQAGSFNISKGVIYLKSILEATSHLHLNGHIHRDIRLTSVFISKDGSVASLAFPQVSRSLFGKACS